AAEGGERRLHCARQASDVGGARALRDRAEHQPGGAQRVAVDLVVEVDEAGLAVIGAGLAFMTEPGHQLLAAREHGAPEERELLLLDRAVIVEPGPKISGPGTLKPGDVRLRG